MTANLEFITEEKQGALSVPTSAVKQKASEAKKSDSGSAPKTQSSAGDDPDRRAMMIERMRERGMSDSEIQERLAQFAAGGGRPGGGKGGGKKGGGEGRRGISYVLIDSGDPDNPAEQIVKIGLSDGSYVEIIEGLKEGDEVLIQNIRINSGKSSGSSSPFTPSMGRGRR